MDLIGNGRFGALAPGDDSMVTAVCDAVGFPDGGYLVVSKDNDDVYAMDALPVQQ